MAVRVGIGAGLAAPLNAQDFFRWVDLCEASGIDSIWVSDQIAGKNPEPLSMLGAIAARTRRVRLGTNVIVIPFRDPVLLAKQVATLDWLCDGRMLPAFGVGHASDPLWAAKQQDPALRGKQADEAIALFRLLLEGGEVQFAGRFFHYDGPGIKPTRPACPPIWTGGDSLAAARRSARLSDGWLGGFTTPEQAGQTVATIKQELTLTGRHIDTDHYGTTLPLRIGGEADPALEKARQNLLHRLPEDRRAQAAASLAIGTAKHIITIIQQYVAQGIEKFVAAPIAHDADDLIRQTRLLAEHVLPFVESTRAH